ncbi:MAG: CinA family protein [Pseudomonadota bacterium]|nr:CinA family protein [Gammaproteobacteria bacterium]MDQ3581994.1 CinA family protein [Pseudomonadota bacterium]
MVNEATKALARQVVSECQNAGCRLVTAESCTGGLLAAVLTSVPGASDVFDRGMVVYASESKSQMLDVALSLLSTHGAVSEQVAVAMAANALALAYPHANMSLAITGVSGPGTIRPFKPTGLVFIACAVMDPSRAIVRCLNFGDVGRDEVRASSVRSALEVVLEQLRVGLPLVPANNTER